MAVERQTAMEVEQSEVRQDVVDYLKEQLVYDQESEKSLNLKKYLWFISNKDIQLYRIDWKERLLIIFFPYTYIILFL